MVRGWADIVSRQVDESSDEFPSVEENLGSIEAGTYVCKHQVYFGKVEKG